MVNHVIVTVMYKASKFDMEIPANIAVEKTDTFSRILPLAFLISYDVGLGFQIGFIDYSHCR